MSVLSRKLRRDLLRRKAQFGAVAITVFLGVALFAASYDSFQNLETSYRRTFTAFRFADLTVTGGDVAAFATRAGGTAGVAAVEARTVADVPLRIDGKKLLGRMVSMPDGRQPAVDRVKVLAGAYPAAGAGALLVERHLADHFGLGPGDELEVGGQAGWVRTSVAGVVSSPEYIWPARSRQEIFTTPENFGVVFVPENTARRLAPGGPNQVVVYYAEGADGSALAARLGAAARDLGAGEILTREEQPSNAALNEDLQGFEELSVFFPFLFLVAAGMAIYVLLTRMVHAQRPQIGVLRAEGYGRRRVLLHYLGYGAVPGVLGAIPGAAAGIGLAFVTTGFYTRVISVPIRIVELRPATLVTGIAIGVLASLVAAAAPALAASRIPPAEAMRGAAPGGPRRPSSLERMLPALRRLPIRWLLVLRGPGRNLRRTLSTILGVILSLTLVLVSWGMLDTTQVLLDRQFLEIDRQDAVVAMGDAAALDRVAATPGVAVAEPSAEVPVSIRRGRESYGSRLVALRPDTRMHRFLTKDGERSLPREGLLVGRALRDLLGIEPGDPVTVVLGDGGPSFSERVAGFVDEPLGTQAYISIDRLRALAGTAVPATIALVRYERGVPRDAVERRLTALPEVLAVEDARAIYSTVRGFMGLFYAFVGMMLAFGAAMAFALIFASMSANIAERSRETASLLAEGMRRRRIAALITAENLLVVLAGVLPGLAIGYVVSSVAMSSFSSDLFSFDLHMRPTTLLFSALALVLVALVSQWPGLRGVRRLDVAQVVRERSL